MQTQTFTEPSLNAQSLVEKIHRLPSEKASEVADFVEFLTERHVKARHAANDRHTAPATKPTSAERARSFREWASGHRDLPTLPDQALQRESFYGERG